MKLIIYIFIALYIKNIEGFYQCDENLGGVGSDSEALRLIEEAFNEN